MIDIGKEYCWNLWKMIIFLVFLAVWVLSPKFLSTLRVAYVTTAQNNKYNTFSCVPDYFSFFLWARFAGSSVESYEK